MMLDRKTLGIDAQLTDKFFTSNKLALETLPLPVMPLPPDNASKLKEFLASKAGDEYKVTTQIALVKLRSILEKHDCDKTLLDIIPRFEKRHLTYGGDAENINSANLRFYREGIPTLITIINIIEQEESHPEKWRIPIINLLQEIDHTCGPGTHTHILTCLKNIKATDNLHAYLKNMQENLVRQHINTIILQAPPKSINKSDEIHIINYIQNKFADKFGFEKIRDAYLSQACRPEYKLLLDKFLAQFKLAIKDIFSVDTIINKLIEFNHQLLTLIESALTSPINDYTSIIKKINQALDFYGPIDANNQLQLCDIFRFDQDEKIIKKHWQIHTILKFNIYERLRLSGYINLSSLQINNFSSLGAICINKQGPLALGIAKPTYQLINETSQTKPSARITIQITPREIFCVDKLKNTYAILSGQNPDFAKKFKHEKLRTSFEKQAEENFRNTQNEINKLKLSTGLLTDDEVQKLKTIFELKESRTSLLLFLVNLYFNNYQQFEIFHKQISLSQSQQDEFDLCVQEEIFELPLISPHINPINNKLLPISHDQLIKILTSLPHDDVRYTFLKNMEFNPTIEKLELSDFLELFNTFNQLSFSLIHLYMLNLSLENKIITLDTIYSHAKQERVSVKSVNELNEILSAFPEISPHHIMQLVNVDLIALLKKQLSNNTSILDPIIRLTNALPLNYLMIALLTHYIKLSNEKINAAGSYSNSYSNNQSYLGQAQCDLKSIKDGNAIPIFERLKELKHSTPLFFSSMYLLYDYLLKQKLATQSELVANSTFKTRLSTNTQEIKNAAKTIIDVFEKSMDNKMKLHYT